MIGHEVAIKSPEGGMGIMGGLYAQLTRRTEKSTSRHFSSRLAILRISPYKAQRRLSTKKFLRLFFSQTKTIEERTR